MYIFGGTMFSMGMSQLGYQLWTWLTSGSWPSFTILSMWAELGGHRPYSTMWMVQGATDFLLDRELSLSMLVVGAAVLVVRPIAGVLAERRAAAVIAMSKKQLADRAAQSSTWTRMDFRHTS